LYRAFRCQAITTTVVLLEYGVVELFRVLDRAIASEDLLGEIQTRVQDEQAVPHRRDTHEADISGFTIRDPAIDCGLERVAMRAAIPEELGNLDLVSTADGRLCRHEARVVLALLELPLARDGGNISLRKHNRLLVRCGFSSRFLDDRSLSLHSSFSGFGSFFDDGLVSDGRLFNCLLCRFFLPAGSQSKQCNAEEERLSH
jgi:hypothetical protein